MKEFENNMIFLSREQLTRISHELTTTAADRSTLTALCSFGLLDVLYENDCGGFISCREPCQAGVFTTSLRKPVRNAGYSSY